MNRKYYLALSITHVLIYALFLALLPIVAPSLNAMTSMLYVLGPSVLGVIAYGILNRVFHREMPKTQNIITSVVLSVIYISVYIAIVMIVNSTPDYFNQIAANTRELLPAEFIIESKGTSLTSIFFPLVLSFISYLLVGKFTAFNRTQSETDIGGNSPQNGQ